MPPAKLLHDRPVRHALLCAGRGKPMLTDEEVIDLVRTHVAKQFPKTCNCCGRVFPSHAVFLLETSLVGDPVSYDAEDGQWQPEDDEGSVAFARCRCGTTLAISSRGMGLRNMWRLLEWSRSRCRERSLTFRGLLSWLRGEIRK